MKSQRFRTRVGNAIIYIILTIFALVMLFPFFFMFFTSFKEPKDTFRSPPRMLPREPVTTMVEGYDEPLPLYNVDYNGQESEFALVESGIRIGVYADPEQPDVTYELPISEVKPTGGFTNQETIIFDGEEAPLFDVDVDGVVIPMVQLSQTALGRFVDPAPWRQKGTGRARAGTRKSPIWRGGGTAFGPKPRDYSFKLNRKVRQQAVAMALSARYQEGNLVVLDDFTLEAIKTKEFVSIMNVLELNNALIVVDADNEELSKSSRNVPGYKVMKTDGVNVYDILLHEKLVVLQPAIERLEERFTA